MREGFSVSADSVVHVILGEAPGKMLTLCGRRLSYTRYFELYTDEEIEQNRKRICSDCNYHEYKEQGLI